MKAHPSRVGLFLLVCRVNPALNESRLEMSAGPFRVANPRITSKVKPLRDGCGGYTLKGPYRVIKGQ